MNTVITETILNEKTVRRADKLSANGIYGIYFIYVHEKEPDFPLIGLSTHKAQPCLLNYIISSVGSRKEHEQSYEQK